MRTAKPWLLHPLLALDHRQLRVASINQRLDTARFAIELQARRHLAILAVALTLTGGAVIGGLSGQIGPGTAGPTGTLGTMVVATQLRGLKRLGQDWGVEVQASREAMETLMLSEEEPGP